MLLDTDWIRLADQVSEEWADHLTEALALIGSTQKESERLSGEVENPVNVEDVFKNTVKWLSATTNSIDNEDAKIVERVSNGFRCLTFFIARLIKEKLNEVGNFLIQALIENSRTARFARYRYIVRLVQN